MHHDGHAVQNVVDSCIHVKVVIFVLLYMSELACRCRACEFMPTLRGHPYGFTKIAARFVTSVSLLVPPSFDKTKDRSSICQRVRDQIL